MPKTNQKSASFNTRLWDNVTRAGSPHQHIQLLWARQGQINFRLIGGVQIFLGGVH